LRTAVNYRVIIIAGDRIKMNARGNGVYIIVLRGSGHRFDSVIVIDCNMGRIEQTLGRGPGGGPCPDGRGRLGRHPNPAGIGIVSVAARPHRAADRVAQGTLLGP